MLGFAVQRQLKAIRKEILNHALPLTSELILAKRLEGLEYGFVPFRFDIELFGFEPARGPRDLIVFDAVYRSDEFL